MSKTPSAPTEGQNRTLSSTPTPYPALNSVLSDYVKRVTALLGNDFIGAYVQGSFALGDFDESSDVDLLVAIERDLGEQEVALLQGLHARIFDSNPPWSRRLELSYFPREVLRRWSPAPRDLPGQPARPDTWKDPGTSGSGPHVYPLLFLGNGERQLARSEQVNTRVVRFVTRERGIVLAGPDPQSLIDEVCAGELRDDVRETMHKMARMMTGSEATRQRGLQALVVLLFCRMLHTVEKGTVVSKKEAAEWALSSLGARWRPLIKRALNARQEPLEALAVPADLTEISETQAFVAFANEKAAVRFVHSSGDAVARARAIIERQLSLKNPGRARDKSQWTSGPSHHFGAAPPKPTRPGGRGRRG